MGHAPPVTRSPASPRLLFWLCFAVAMVDGFDTLVVSFIAPAFAAEWELPAEAVGRLFAAGLLGAAIGAVTAGSLADRVGRRTALLGCVGLFTVATLLCAAAPDPGTLAALRLVAGLGLGGAIPSITALTAESLPLENRAGGVTRMFLGFPLGAVLGGALVASIIGPLGWRAAFLLGGAAGAALLPPLWLYVTDAAPGDRHHDGSRREPLLAHGRALPAAALFAAAFLVLLVSYFLINWSPSILVRAGMSEERSILGGVLLNVGGIMGALLLAALVGRTTPFRVVGLTLLVGGALVVALGAGLSDPNIAAPLLLATGAGVVGGQLTFPALAAALFPRSARATGVGLTMGAGRAGSIVGPYCGGLLLDAGLGWGPLFLIIAVPTAVAGFLVLVAGWRSPVDRREPERTLRR